MDHEKPQAVFPQASVREYQDTHRGSDTSDTIYAITPDLEREDVSNVVELGRNGGESLWRVLTERQINMIAFSGTIGNGLFLGSGTTVARAGPGGAILAYALMGTVVSSIMSCLGEMTALFPVNAPMMEFPKRFLDRGLGFAVGWMYWQVPAILFWNEKGADLSRFANATIAAQELTAVTRIIQFKYDDGKTYLAWAVGDSVDPAIWMTLFFILVITINMFPVKYFGELEYIFGSIKLTFISMMTIMMLVLATITPRSNAYYHKTLGTKYWDSPYSFFNHKYAVQDQEGNIQRYITGTVGTFLGEWTGIIKAVFSFTGMDIFAATAAESKSLGDAESMKMAARKISIRIVTVYCCAVFAASFVVPYNHPYLNGPVPSVSAGSIFIIAVVEAGIPKAAHLFNAIFVLSAFTCAINSMFVASRVLHTLALQNQTGPMWITKRLRQCNSGVPRRAVLMTSAITLLGYMGRTGKPGERLGQISSNCAVTYLIIFATIGATYLSFFQTLEQVKYSNISASQAECYDRDNPRYPYKSHGQWLKAAYGMTACIILLIFNGLYCFFEEPFDGIGFVVSYIGIPVYILLICLYKFSKFGFKVSQWGPERSKDLSGAIQSSSENRKGRLKFPNSGLTKENTMAFLRWAWAWIK